MKITQFRRSAKSLGKFLGFDGISYFYFSQKKSSASGFFTIRKGEGEKYPFFILFKRGTSKVIMASATLNVAPRTFLFLKGRWIRA